MTKLNFLPKTLFVCSLLLVETHSPALANVIDHSAAHATAQSTDQTSLAAMPISQIVESRLYPQLDYFSKKLREEKLNTKIDGHPAFNGKDKFLPGKIALGLAHVLVNTAKNKKNTAQAIQDFRNTTEMTLSLDNHTWGIYYYLLALYELKKAGLLEAAVSKESLLKLKEKLDWRSFVSQSDFKLINLPTNYYGVAFGVARLRSLLDWEDDYGSNKLLDILLNHYEKHSGTYGFSDETEGEGRFDRYSILLIAEICERFIETGKTVTPELKTKLRKATDIALRLSNTKGDGFTFGRSIGVYGETAILEILSVSAYLDVLTPEEKEYAYAISQAIFAKYVNFWFDPTINSVDLWGKGRRTDSYRGIHRILGENYSLTHQLIAANELWHKAGFNNRVPKKDLQSWLDKTQSRFSFTWFARAEYDRALAIYRDRQHVFSLLMINGGATQHANSPYYPLPFSSDIISGIADSGAAHPQLLPKFTLEDGTELIPTAFMKQIKTTESNKENPSDYKVQYKQDAMTRVADGNKSPIKDPRIQLDTQYTFQPGVITRTDTYVATSNLKVSKVSLEFTSFSEGAIVDGTRIHFAQGTVNDFEVTGMNSCTAEKTNGAADYQSTTGAMKTRISCQLDAFTMDKPVTIKWLIRYH